MATVTATTNGAPLQRGIADASQSPELAAQYSYYQYSTSLPRTENHTQVTQIQSPTQIQPPQEQVLDETATQSTVVAGKRRHLDDSAASSPSAGKRRRARDEDWDHDDPDLGPNGGPKHWTDQEKSSLFTWILCHDAHWDAFNTKMNTVFRDTSVQIFGGRKSFTALKSCFHRNLDVFKQIFALEAFLARNTPEGTAAPPHFDSASERQAYLEERLEAARAAGAPVGNINVKIIDHWYANGWYVLFKARYQEDPKTGLPIALYGMGRPSTADAQGTIDPVLAAVANSPPSLIPPPVNIRVAPPPQPQQYALPPPVPYPGTAPAQAQAQSQPQASTSQTQVPVTWQTQKAQPEYRRQPLSAAPTAQTIQSAPSQHYTSPARAQAQTNDTVVAALDRLTTMTQTLVETCNELSGLLRTQQQQGTEGKREEGLNVKEKAALAMEMLGNEDMGEEVKRAAAEYLKRLFMSE